MAAVTFAAARREAIKASLAHSRRRGLRRVGALTTGADNDRSGDSDPIGHRKSPPPPDAPLDIGTHSICITPPNCDLACRKHPSSFKPSTLGACINMPGITSSLSHKRAGCPTRRRRTPRPHVYRLAACRVSRQPTAGGLPPARSALVWAGRNERPTRRARDVRAPAAVISAGRAPLSPRPLSAAIATRIYHRV